MEVKEVVTIELSNNMQTADLIQNMVQILSNPAWGGVGVIISSALSVAAIIQSRHSQPHIIQPHAHLLLKK